MKLFVVVALAVLLTAGVIWLASGLESGSSGVKEINKSEKDQVLVVDIQPEHHGDYIVYCNEERFQRGFDRLRKFVGVKSPALTAPGGPMLIALADISLDPELQAPKRVLIEVLKRHAPKRVVLMVHEGCLIYDSIGAWYDDSTSVRTRQFAHLRQARDALYDWFPRTSVEIFYGEKVDETTIRFYPVSEESLEAAGAYSLFQSKG